MLEARQVTVRMEGATLLENVSIVLRPGEVLAVAGPNGAGKSTLLRVLSGGLYPTTGDVFLDGRTLRSWPAQRLAQSRAVLSQQSGLTFAFTSMEVALLGRTPHDGDHAGSHAREVAAAALEYTEALHLAHRNYLTLSGGERQRVQLARVLAQIWESRCGSRYLLLDEPTAALDMAHQHRTLEIVRDFARRDSGVLVILHDLNLAAQYADRLLLLKNGCPHALGSPEDILRPEVILDVFGVPVRVIDHPTNGTKLVVAECLTRDGSNRPAIYQESVA
jgi:iron complex transport system ATP-binding protein